MNTEQSLEDRKGEMIAEYIRTNSLLTEKNMKLQIKVDCQRAYILELENEIKKLKR